MSKLRKGSPGQDGIEDLVKRVNAMAGPVPASAVIEMILNRLELLENRLREIETIQLHNPKKVTMEF